MGIGEVKLHTLENGDGVPVMDIAAKHTPEKGVIVVHTSMETPLDPNQLYQLATIAGTNPEYRVIGFGNPSGDRYYFKAQELSFLKRLRVALFKDMRPIIAPELDYLKQNGISEWYQIGYSYGALKATTESEYMERGSLKGLLLVDPVARPRNLIKLMRDFSKTYGPLGKYVNSTNLETYHKARGDAALNRNHNKALLRPINVTIAVALSRIAVLKRLKRVMTRQPQMKTMVAWGTASEIGDDAYMQKKLDALSAHGRIERVCLEGLEHAFANDVHLHAAIIKQFLA